MSINTAASQTDDKSEVTGLNRVRMVIRAIVYITLLPAVIFLAAGRLDWIMAWVYVGLMLISAIVSRSMMLRKYPDLVEERAHALEKEDTKAWDRILVRLVAFFGPVVILVVAGLDMRFGWSPEISLGLQLAALVIIVLAYLLGHWAVLSNRFFSTTVRIQKERGHTVATGGPYRYIRHPGYAGGVITHLATPVLLGSLWALVPALLTGCLLVVRTALEDKTLQNELDGYQAYAQRVRRRLLPGIW